MNVLLDILPVDIMELHDAACAAVRLQKVSEPYCISFTDFMTDFKVVIPDRNLWDRIVPASVDWSKLYNRVGGGVYSKELGICKCLLDHCSVFEAELHEAVNCLRSLTLSDNRINIFWNSQATLQVLASVTVKSKTVQDCHRSLNVMAKPFSLNLVWVPGHSNLPLSPSWKSLGMSLSTCKLNIRELFIKDANLRWISLNTCNGTVEGHETLSS